MILNIFLYIFLLQNPVSEVYVHEYAPKEYRSIVITFSQKTSDNCFTNTNYEIRYKNGNILTIRKDVDQIDKNYIKLLDERTILVYDTKYYNSEEYTNKHIMLNKEIYSCLSNDFLNLSNLEKLTLLEQMYQRLPIKDQLK